MRYRRRLKQSLILAAVLAVLLGACSSALWATTPATHAGGAIAAQDNVVLEPLDEDAPLPIRQLPIVSKDGLLDEAFPDGVRRADQDALVGVLYHLAGRLGWSDVIDQVLATEPPPESVNIAHYRYPFDFGDVDSWSQFLVTPELLASHEADLVDFSAAVAMLAAMGWTPGENYRFGPLAYSLLRRATELSPSCDLQLNLAYIVSLGQSPQSDDLRAETRRAARLCGEDDLTAAWLHAITESRHIHVIPSFLGASDVDPSERIRGVELEFADLRRTAPDSPLGWAGQADLYLRLADETEEAGHAPFQARSWRRQARELYTQARTRSGHPDLLAGHARALSRLGRDDEASELMKQLLDLDPTNLAYQTTSARLLMQTHHYREAAAVITESPDPVLPWWAKWDYDDPDSFAAATVPMTLIPDGSLFEAGGADVSDTGFIPTSRFGSPQNWYCRNEVSLRAMILAGQARRALDLLNGGVSPTSLPGGLDCGTMTTEPPNLIDADELTAIAAAAAGDVEARDEAIERRFDGPVDATSLNSTYDAAQDLFRAYSDYDAAARLAEAWVDAAPDDWMAWHRSGEIAFLRGRYDDAIRFFDQAAKLVETELASTGDNMVDVGLDLSDMPLLLDLDRGTAHAAAGRESRARDAFEQVLTDSALQSKEYPSYWFEIVVLHAHAELGALDIRAAEWESAVAHLEQAVTIGRGKQLFNIRMDGSKGEPLYWGPLRGAQENNLALALANTDATGRAVSVGKQALTRDPSNPIYRDTLAYAYQQAGDTARAVATYQDALEEDPTSYVSANNLAVMLAQAGRTNQASELLQSAVAARPDYALAWHNLGELKATSWSVTALRESQGALARAARLDHELRGATDGLMVDTDIHRSNLDVSRPLAPDWSYASTAGDRSNGLAVTLVILLALRAVWALGLDRLGGSLAERLARHREVTSRRRLLWIRRPAIWTLCLSVLVLAWPAARAAGGGPAGLLSLTAIVTLVLLPLILRAFVAASEPGRHHFSWPPAMVFSAAGAPFGIMFVPFPSLGDEPLVRSRPLLRWVAPACVGVVAAVCLVVTALTSVPLVRVVAIAAVALVASMLTPVSPFDGAHLRGRMTNAALTGALGVVTVAVALQWV